MQVVNYGHRLGAVAALGVGHAQRYGGDSLIGYIAEEDELMHLASPSSLNNGYSIRMEL